VEVELDGDERVLEAGHEDELVGERVVRAPQPPKLLGQRVRLLSSVVDDHEHLEGGAPSGRR
jgi:hypothetical protein